MNLRNIPSLRNCMGLALLGFCLTICASCGTPEDPMMDFLDTQSASVKIDNLSRTMNFVASPVRFQKSQFEERMAASLNRWGKSESELLTPDDWKLDQLAKEAADHYGDLPVATAIPGLGFLNTDSFNLQENYWAKEIASRKSADTAMAPYEIYRVASGIGEVDNTGNDDDHDSDPLAKALQKLHEGISAEDSQSLADAVKMFDFVVRNIHLLPDDLLTGDVDDVTELRLNDGETNPAAGIPGLGYTRFPWQTLLFSRGDYVERAKLFITLLNQLDLDSVMFSTEIVGQQKPWAVGVNIGGKLYMFDTKLGLPVPHGNSGQIATFAELRSDPELLDALDLSVKESLKDATEYWVKADQLKNVEALVYLPPEAASYRYFELESKLVGDTRMNLVIQPSKVIAKMPQLSGIQYGVWEIGFKTHQFRRALRDAISESGFNNNIRKNIRWYNQDELYINEFVRYRTARAKYFKGIYETIRNDGNLNAIELFYSMIYKDGKIQSLATDPVFQVQLSLTQGGQSANDFQSSIAGVQSNMRLVRRDSGYFLSQCHFDLGNYSTASNWLTRLEEIENTQRWQAAINYLRARSLEAQRDYDSAIDIYSKQESEQFHGDLLRVRLLKQITGASGEAKQATDDVEERQDEADEQAADGADEQASDEADEQASDEADEQAADETDDESDK